MPRLIIKNSYLKGGGRNAPHRSHLVKYIATRDGVQFLYQNPHDIATAKQKSLIKNILLDFPNAKNSFEYEDYRKNPSIENASEFITVALEQNLDRIGKRENYVGYIAKRPNVEKINTHGLFTNGDEKIILSKVAEEIANHEGNIWTPIISLRREDAIETGYDNVERWKNMLESYIPTVAESMKIPIDKFRWYAAFHNESHHPHIHMICYSTDTRYGYLTRQGIDKIKSGMMKEIFKEQLFRIYELQTDARNKLKSESEKVFQDLKNQIANSDYSNPKLEDLIAKLNQKLKVATGKKQYGYLQPKVKALVDEIANELAKEPSIKSAYELWCELQNEIYRSYQDTMPDPIPLSQQKEFKSIKNMIIREVMSLDTVQEFAEEEYIEDTEPQTPFDSVAGEYHIEWNENYKQAKEYLYADEPNIAKAFELLSEESEKLNALAMFDLATMYENGLGVEKDKDRAYNLYSSALLAFEEIESKKPWRYLEYRIGKMYAKGLGTDKDEELAAEWFGKSAKEKYKFAEYSFGSMYHKGQGVEQSDEMAFSLFLRAAKQGIPYAQYEVAKMYRDGIGTEVNADESKEWFRKSFFGFEVLEKQNHEDNLQYKLGAMLLNGVGVDKDIQQAISYLEKSAEQGNQYAQYQLGKLYLLGKDVDRDKEMAIKYLTMSAEQGNEYAKFFVDNMDKWRNPAVGISVFRLLSSLSRIFEENRTQDSTTRHYRADKKLRQKTNAKKKALGQKIENEEQYEIEQTMQM